MQSLAKTRTLRLDSNDDSKNKIKIMFEKQKKDNSSEKSLVNPEPWE